MRNDPRAMSAGAVECQLGGDIHGLTTAAFRTEVLASRFHLNRPFAALIASMALGEVRV
jgi:hypothetical protein